MFGELTIRRRAARLPIGELVIAIEADRHQLEVQPPARLLEWSRNHLGNGRYLHLVAIPSSVLAINLTSRQRTVTGMHRLIEPTDVLPAELDDATYRTMPDSVQELYRHVYDDVVEVTEHVLPDLEIIDVDMDGFAATPRNWTPGAAGALLGPGFDHSFPGYLTGFRHRAIEIAREYARDVWEHQSQHYIEARVQAYFDPPRHRPASGRGRRAVPAREEFTTTTVRIETPASIAGGSLVDAQQRWAEAEAGVRAQLEAKSKARKCSHCNGEGWVVCPKD